MIYNNNSLITIFHISKLFNLPSEINYIIYYHIVHTSAQFIIDKWHSYVLIHNINICYIANKIPILRAYTTLTGHICYYDLHNKDFYIVLKLCAKYIKPNISSKTWWYKFIYHGFNGVHFIHDRNDIIVCNCLSKLHYILGCLK